MEDFNKSVGKEKDEKYEGVSINEDESDQEEEGKEVITLDDSSQESIQIITLDDSSQESIQIIDDSDCIPLANNRENNGEQDFSNSQPRHSRRHLPARRSPTKRKV